MQEVEARNDRLAAAQAIYEARLTEGQARDAKIAADNQYAADQLAMIDAILVKSVSEPQFSLGALKYTASHPAFDPGQLDRPTARPTLAVAPPKPSYSPPACTAGPVQVVPKGSSVPFGFDVHALFISDDAVGVEAELHRRFADQRVNRVNTRREYFYATPAAVEIELAEVTGNLLEFNELADAEQYGASELMRAGEQAELR
jgi:hypothetical protein